MEKIDNYIPLGFEFKYEKRIFIWGIVLSLLYGSFFFRRFYYTWDNLFERVWKNGELVKLGVKEGAVMKDFVELFDNASLGFFIVAVYMVLFVFLHYAYFKQESKSIYLMKRLPNKWELHKRCITIPLIEIGICFIVAFLFLLLCYTVYMVVTPAECIVGNQWKKIWEIWLR